MSCAEILVTLNFDKVCNVLSNIRNPLGPTHTHMYTHTLHRALLQCSLITLQLPQIPSAVILIVYFHMYSHMCECVYEKKKTVKYRISQTLALRPHFCTLFSNFLNFKHKGLLFRSNKHLDCKTQQIYTVSHGG